MARSGSVDYSVTAVTVVTKAARVAGLLGDGQTLNAGIQSNLMQSLNMMVKQWQGRSDFAPGLKVWTRRRATLFLQDSQHKYLVGPTGDHATDSFVETTLTAASAANDTTMTVASISGISSGDYVGVWLDSGTVHWTTASISPSGVTVTLTTGISSAASSGKRLVAYTTKARRPLDILTAVIRDSDENDIPLNFLSLTDYDGIKQKSCIKTPEAIFYEAQLDNGVIYTDSNPDDVTKDIKLTYLSDIEDIDTASDDFDYPNVWYLPLALNLAILACVEYQRAVPTDLRTEASTALIIARNQYPETCQDYFQPGLD